ncbi:MAG TPA: MFS transporter [Kineosporiaceae bacterium]|nr:MFS transporter [Kineosporiaceae bacterium]
MFTPTERPAPSTAFRVVTARNAVAAVFFLNGLAIASWFARIPAAKQALDLSAGKFGLVLLGLSAGAVLAMVTAGASASRFGTGQTVAGASTMVAVGLVVAGIGTGMLNSVPVTVAGLLAVGYGSGTCDVAMNVEAAMVERRLGRTVMPRFHAAWSIGTVTGAAIGALASRLGSSIEVNLITIAVLGAVGSLIAVRSFLPAGMVAETAEGAPGSTRMRAALSAWSEPRTLLIGLLVLVMAFTEGSANDWVALAFVDGYRISEAGGAVVFGVFVAAMTLGRTVGTIALDRWGRVRVLVATMLLAAAGATLAILAGSLAIAVIGVAFWGLGASLGFPVGMSAAADDESRAAARVSVVALIGYTAFLAGPPVVGLLGDQVGVLRALLVVPVLLIPALALVPVSREPTRREPLEQ